MVEHAVAQDVGVVHHEVDAAIPACHAAGVGDRAAGAVRLVIWATTSCTGPASRPSPVTMPPMSLSTTLVPLAASSKAMARPMPPPEPVIHDAATRLACRPSLPSGQNRGGRGIRQRRTGPYDPPGQGSTGA
jgi:hypothetical protein